MVHAQQTLCAWTFGFVRFGTVGSSWNLLVVFAYFFLSGLRKSHKAIEVVSECAALGPTFCVLFDGQCVQSPSDDRLSSPSIVIIIPAVAKRCDVFICKSPMSRHPLS
jgi:hypothetical protein